MDAPFVVMIARRNIVLMRMRRTHSTHVFTFHALVTVKFSSRPLVDRYSVVTDERTPIRFSDTRNAYPGTCCSQSFDSDGWKRDMNIPCSDAIDRALRALSNDTKLASNGSSVAEIQSLHCTKVTLKIAKDSIPRSHCP